MVWVGRRRGVGRVVSTHPGIYFFIYLLRTYHTRANYNFERKYCTEPPPPSPPQNRFLAGRRGEGGEG